MKIEVSEQVSDFIRCLPPELKKRIRHALRELVRGKGNIKPLDGELSGFYRLRVGRLRVIYHHAKIGRRYVFRCIFIHYRSVVYEVFAQLMLEKGNFS